MTADSDSFRRAMGRYATGVSVMTVRCGDGEPHGMTANAVSSVSLDPLLVLVCVARDTVMSRLVSDAGAFGLSFLAARDEQLSNHFADPSRPRGAGQFVGVQTVDGPTGTPLLVSALATLDCRVWKVHDGGDHDIVVGEVVDLHLGPDEAALGYYQSGYLAIDPPAARS